MDRLAVDADGYVSVDQAGLNPQQMSVVLHADGPLLAAAGAGVGKTRAITHRISYLVSRGIDPERILAVAFNVKAAKEMNTRLRQLGVRRVAVSTFHGLAWRIIREEQPHLARWQVDDTERYRYVVKDALGFKVMNWKAHDLTVVLSYIARCKASAALPGSERAMELAKQLHSWSPCPQRDPTLLAQAYVEAEAIRQQKQLLTFDDQLLEAWNLLQDENVRQRWAGRYSHVLQDECQDENLVQREIMERLARDHRCYTVVGDPAQAIYKFRGSDPSGMLNFQRVWGADVIHMDRNYRSGRRIIACANRVLDAMEPDTHLGIKIVADRDLDGEITVTRYASFDDEGEGVVERIRQAHDDGRSWGEIAVLYRTNAQSRGVEEALLSARLPYVVIGGTNFYDRKEVKDLLAYLRLAAGRGTFDDVRRAINTPYRFLGKVFVVGVDELSGSFPETASWTEIVRHHANGAGRLQSRQRTSALEWCALVDEMAAVIERAMAEGADAEARLAARPARLLETLMLDIDYAGWLMRDEGTESPENNRVSNVRELIRAAERFPTAAELLDYIDETLRKAAEVRDHDETDCVTLTTLHRSKGLEWPIVHLIGCNQKILPHARAEDKGEERRLFYVGVTRARDELHLSCVCEAAVGAIMLPLPPSQFIAEAGLEVTDHSSCQAH